MRPAARLLMIESTALPTVLEGRNRWEFERPTVLPGWSVRDVLAHCSAALGRVTTGALHGFTPADNQADVDARRDLSIPELVEELTTGYTQAADAIDRADGAYDGVGLGEWIHGGDVRDGLDAPLAYSSAGSDLAIGLLAERSATRFAGRLDVTVGRDSLSFGGGDTTTGSLTTDVETFVRLCAGRRPDPDRYGLRGATEQDLILFR